MTAYQRKGKKYSKITYEKRIELLDLILNQGQKITETAKKLHLKLPTVKAILSNYRKKNYIFQRRQQALIDNREILKHQTHLKQEVNQDFQRISQMGVQKSQSNQNEFQLNQNKCNQNDVSSPYLLWIGYMNPWEYFHVPPMYYGF